ncbi:MAG: hypothetical protein WD226_05915 [Planctomycetota bacterium]
MVPPPPNGQQRSARRRSEDERIAELQEQIQELKARATRENKKNDPIVREIDKVQRRLQKFAQLAQDEGRTSLANSVIAFLAGLDRTQREILEEPSRPRPGE